MTDEQIGVSLIETLKDSELPVLLRELAEIPLDSLMEEGALRDIPIIGTLHGLWKAGVTIRDYVFVRKLLRFLGTLSEVPREERSRMIERLEQDKAYGEKVGEEIILLLDRLDSLKKAELMGRAFKAYCRGYVDGETLQRINLAIDRVILRDLSKLERFCDDRRQSNIGNATRQSFVNAGLAYVPVGLASTDIRPNHTLCRAFIQYVLKADSEQSAL